jgi:hypothetical protein
MAEQNFGVDSVVNSEIADVNQEVLSKSESLVKKSFIFGLLGPALFVAFFVLLILLAVVTAGFGVLIIIALYQSYDLLILLVTIPLGIVALIFGLRAWKRIKLYKFPRKNRYRFAIALSIFDILAPIIIIGLGIKFPSSGFIPNYKTLCIYNHFPGNGGCLAIPYLPVSWQKDNTNNPNVPFTESDAQNIALQTLNSSKQTYTITKVTAQSDGWVFDYSLKNSPNTVDVYDGQYENVIKGPIFVGTDRKSKFLTAPINFNTAGDGESGSVSISHWQYNLTVGQSVSDTFTNSNSNYFGGYKINEHSNPAVLNASISGSTLQIQALQVGYSIISFCAIYSNPSLEGKDCVAVDITVQ